MSEIINLKYVLNSVIFSLVGIITLIVGFVIIDLITPKVHIWKELVEKQNTAVAVLLGAMALGIAQIIASAIHG